MADTAETTKRVDPKKIYNVSEIRRENLFPWISANNHISYINAIYEDMTADNLLKVRASGSGRGREYQIKGINIITYLTKKNHDTKK